MGRRDRRRRKEGGGGEGKKEGMRREGREKGTGRGPQFKKSDPSGYGPVFAYRRIILCCAKDLSRFLTPTTHVTLFLIL